MFIEGISLKQKMMAWALLVILFGAIGLIIVGAIIDNVPMQIIGTAPVLVFVFSSIIYSRRRAKRDSAFAKALVEAQNRTRPRQVNTLQGFIIVTTATLSFISVNALRLARWNISALARPMQIAVLLVGLSTAFVVIVYIRRLTRRIPK